MSDGVGAYSLGVDLGTTFVAAAVALTLNASYLAWRR